MSPSQVGEQVWQDSDVIGAIIKPVVVPGIFTKKMTTSSDSTHQILRKTTACNLGFLSSKPASFHGASLSGSSPVCQTLMLAWKWEDLG